MIHEHFCYNRRTAATTSLGSGTGTAEDGGASPLGSARRSCDAVQRFRDELS
jgi:hypothetical protein